MQLLLLLSATLLGCLSLTSALPKEKRFAWPEKADYPTMAGVHATDGSYIETVLKHHNVHRSNHSAPNIKWGPHMALAAKVLADTCDYGHNVTIDGGGYGQNIAAGTVPSDISTIITNEFYNAEEPNFHGYGKANPSFADFDSWGHFSQIVWKGSKRVGCYTSDCRKKGLKNVGSDVEPYFTVCNYWPPGNIGGEYGENIGRPLGRPSVYANY